MSNKVSLPSFRSRSFKVGFLKFQIFTWIRLLRDCITKAIQGLNHSQQLDWLNFCTGHVIEEKHLKTASLFWENLDNSNQSSAFGYEWKLTALVTHLSRCYASLERRLQFLLWKRVWNHNMTPAKRFHYGHYDAKLIYLQTILLFIKCYRT